MNNNNTAPRYGEAPREKRISGGTGDGEHVLSNAERAAINNTRRAGHGLDQVQHSGQGPLTPSQLRRGGEPDRKNK